MLGKKYINEHTPDDGFIVNCVYIQEQLAIEKQIYLEITVDLQT